MEGWPSGLRHTLGKRAGAIPHRFESCTLRLDMSIKYSIIFKLKKLYWFLARPKSFGVKCILENNGKILMIRRTFGTDKWVFPGGAIHSGESPEEAVRREIEEDLGIDLEEVRNLGSFAQNVHHRRETLHCFAAPALREGLHIDHGKIKEVKWFVRDQLPFLTPISKSVFSLYAKGSDMF